ncbi:dTDP-6-deoxy-3,4-keto-hexulose isomerase [Aeromonas jandaei]|uniref:sugar 3,4-ketoisomerase n=1 Tax=Aeromonas jandaei TaxID=650 RepID=UPI00194FD72E|nr:FdtA/QdtA family cupin domain-containing protein [Aeromonas jandaei]BCS48556.1 dTDP-6-deoxy-3,4-keto-hexulose isomerase [Aeromonas jandaei]
MNLIELIDFPVLGDERGSLIALENNNQIPFNIKRIYYIYGTKQGVARGFHAHKKLKQVAICINGSCRFVMDNGLNKEEVILDTPSKGLLIDTMQWHEMHDFSSDCILLVLASDVYNESDYVRDYGCFLSEIENEM